MLCKDDRGDLLEVRPPDLPKAFTRRLPWAGRPALKNANSVQEGGRQPRTANAQLPCRGEEWGNLSGTGFVQRFLSVDAIMPGSVMSNAIASHRSIPPVTPKNKRAARVKRQAYLLQGQRERIPWLVQA